MKFTSIPIAVPLSLLACVFAEAQTTRTSTTAPAEPLAVRGETIYAMSGDAIHDGVILLRDGKIERVGRAPDVQIPQGMKTLTAKVVTPGLIDAHTIVGLQGFLNEPRDQDQLEKSSPVQPELRATDAFNGRERLLEWIRGFGITTIHTGPAPGELVPGQTMIIKTRGPEVDDGLLNGSAMLSIHRPTYFFLPASKVSMPWPWNFIPPRSLSRLLTSHSPPSSIL